MAILRRRRLPVTLAAVLASGWAQAAGVAVSLERAAPGRYHIHGRFEVGASTAIAREVITDYDGIGRFVSSIRSSRVLKRDSRGVLIRQVGTARFLFFSRSVTLTLRVTETPQSVFFKQVGKSPFKLYEGVWAVKGARCDSQVTYELTAQPGGSLGLRAVAGAALKRNVRRLLDDVRREIERRGRAEPASACRRASP